MAIVDMAKSSEFITRSRVNLNVGAGIRPLNDRPPAPEWHTHGTVDGFNLGTLMGAVGVSGSIDRSQAGDIQATLQQGWNGNEFVGLSGVSVVPQAANSLSFIPSFAAHRSPSAEELEAAANGQTHRLWVPVIVTPDFSVG